MMQNPFNGIESEAEERNPLEKRIFTESIQWN